MIFFWKQKTSQKILIQNHFNVILLLCRRFYLFLVFFTNQNLQIFLYITHFECHVRIVWFKELNWFLFGTNATIYTEKLKQISADERSKRIVQRSYTKNSNKFKIHLYIRQYVHMAYVSINVHHTTWSKKTRCFGVWVKLHPKVQSFSNKYN